MRVPELPDEMKAKLHELEDLSEEAEAGDKKARRELRRELRAASSEIVAECSDIAGRGHLVLAETMAAGKPLMQEAILVRLDLMRAEIAGENPTPLEVLLMERVVSSWLVVEVLEALMNAQLKRGEGVPRASISYLKFVIRWLESANHRYLASIRELARVRKLQSSLPNAQTNIQLNLG